MENSKKVKEAAKRVFDKLSKMDSGHFKALLATCTEGDVYRSMKDLYSFGECEEGDYRCYTQMSLASSTSLRIIDGSASTDNDYSLVTEQIWALAA